MRDLPQSHHDAKYVDALVVGAGFAGIYATKCLKDMSFNVLCIERGAQAGGVWYFNRYPGCMSDTESFLFRYSWDKEDLQTYPWSRRYLYQPEIFDYLNHVVDRHHLRQYMQFNTEMVSATWNELERLWTIECSTGQKYVAKYFISAIGGLSEPRFPEIDRIDSFEGTLVHTQDWPESLDLAGKRVGVIGNGSTGVQLMTAIAPIVKQLVSFQRSPQYSVPSGQRALTKDERQKINDDYEQIYRNVWNSAGGYNLKEVDTPMRDFSPEEIKRIFDDLWDQGNAFRFFVDGFSDIGTDLEANKETCKYIRSRIDQIVHDPDKARILKPTDLYNRRPLCDSGYYQTFNRDNVSLVYLRETPISRIVPDGIQLTNGTVHELDVIVVATGFDVFEGAYARTVIEGSRGQRMSRHWKNGPSTYGGIAMAGFPNMFTIFGPQGPFANGPSVIETEINFVMELIRHAEEQARDDGQDAGGSTRPLIEVRHAAEQDWRATCEKGCKGSLFNAPGSWIFGQNIPGRKPSPNWYFPGLTGYLSMVKSQRESGYSAFTTEDDIRL